MNNEDKKKSEELFDPNDKNTTILSSETIIFSDNGRLESLWKGDYPLKITCSGCK